VSWNSNRKEEPAETFMRLTSATVLSAGEPAGKSWDFRTRRVGSSRKQVSLPVRLSIEEVYVLLPNKTALLSWSPS